jgi:hypothetical protein
LRITQIVVEANFVHKLGLVLVRRTTMSHPHIGGRLPVPARGVGVWPVGALPLAGPSGPARRNATKPSAATPWHMS